MLTFNRYLLSTEVVASFRNKALFHLPQGQMVKPHHYLLVARSHEITVAKPTVGKKRRRKRRANEDSASVGGQEQPVFDSYENEILLKVGQ